MNEERIIELEIKQAYQEDLIQALNRVVSEQQKQIDKLEQTCKFLHDKIKGLNQTGLEPFTVDEKPPHY